MIRPLFRAITEEHHRLFRGRQQNTPKACAALEIPPPPASTYTYSTFGVANTVRHPPPSLCTLLLQEGFANLVAQPENGGKPELSTQEQ